MISGCRILLLALKPYWWVERILLFLSHFLRCMEIMASIVLKMVGKSEIGLYLAGLLEGVGVLGRG